MLKLKREINMAELTRFSVSLETELLDSFDQFCSENHLATRSEAVRQLIREKLTANAWATNAQDVAASLTLVYDHHRTRLTDKMLELQHAQTDRVVSSMHVHLNHDLCLEVIVLRGSATELQRLASELSGLKGIHQAQLVVARADDQEPDSLQEHSHTHPH